MEFRDIKQQYEMAGVPIDDEMLYNNIYRKKMREIKKMNIDDIIDNELKSLDELDQPYIEKIDSTDLNNLIIEDIKQAVFLKEYSYANNIITIYREIEILEVMKIKNLITVIQSDILFRSLIQYVTKKLTDNKSIDVVNHEFKGLLTVIELGVGKRENTDSIFIVYSLVIEEGKLYDKIISIIEGVKEMNKNG